MRLIAFLTERSSIEQILNHIGEPSAAPLIAPARAPPASTADFDQRPAWEPQVEAAPEINYDQRHHW